MFDGGANGWRDGRWWDCGGGIAVVVGVVVGLELKRLRGELWRYREAAASLLRQVHDLESINRQLRGTVHELERKR